MKVEHGLFGRSRRTGSYDARAAARVALLFILVIIQLGIDAILILGFPSEGRDFVIQMTAGRVASIDGPEHLYEPAIQLQRQSEVLCDSLAEDSLLPFNHTPILVPALRPLSSLSNGRAYLVWTVFSLILLLLSTLFMTAGFSARGATGMQSTLSRLAILTFFPVAVSIAQGQDTSILLLGVAAWIALMHAGRDVESGLLLSLATVRPHIALGLAIPFLFARRRIFVGFFVGTAALATYSVILVGLEGVFDYLDLIRATSIGGMWPIGQSRMPNLLGLLIRVGGDDSTQMKAAVAWLAWLGFMIAASIRWWRLGPRTSALHGCVLIVGTVLLVPHIHIHDSAVLAVAALGVARARLTGSRIDWDVPVVALMFASLLLTVVSISQSPVFDICLAAAILLIGVPVGRELLDPPGGGAAGLKAGH